MVVRIDPQSDRFSIKDKSFVMYSAPAIVFHPCLNLMMGSNLLVTSNVLEYIMGIICNLSGIVHSLPSTFR